jgi:lysophospholipase L1-like esterase
MSTTLPLTGCSPGSGAGLARTADKPLLARLALFGDSITELGGGGTHIMNANGAWGWARCFNGGGWDPAINGTKLTFATSGKRSDELNVLWLSGILGAAPDACAILYGTNDAAQLRPVQSFLNDCAFAIGVMRAAGIRPLMFEVLPMSGSGQESRQAKVAEYNLALRTFCRDRNVPLCRWAHVLETAPDTGIGSAAYTPDNIHPNALAAALLGRYKARFLRKHFRFGDVWRNTRWISPNWRMEGVNGVPSGWNAYEASGGSFGSKSIIPDPAGNWWQLPMIKGTSTGNFSFATFGANTGGAVAGKLIESICELKVISGEVGGNCLQGYSNPGVQLQVVVNNASDHLAKISPLDGTVTLRTTQRILAGDRTDLFASLLLSPVGAAATIRIRRMGCREIV